MGRLLLEIGLTHNLLPRMQHCSSKRKAERHTEADLSKRLVVELCAAQANVEGDVVADLPDRADERRPGRRADEIALVEDLRDGSPMANRADPRGSARQRRPQSVGA
jgi:hypothetical protein